MPTRRNEVEWPAHPPVVDEQPSPASMGPGSDHPRRSPAAALVAMAAVVIAVVLLVVVLLRVDEDGVVATSATEDQLAVLREGCRARGLYYDDLGTCYSVDPGRLDPDRRADFRVEADFPVPATPEPATPEPPLPAPTAFPVPTGTPVPRATPVPTESAGPAAEDEQRAAPPDAQSSAVKGGAPGLSGMADGLTLVEPFRSRPPGASAGAEVHMIGAATSDGNVRVVVQDLGVPVVVVASAYWPLEWSIVVEPGARVEYVILSGYHAQRAFMQDDSIPVYYSSYEEGGSFDNFHASRDDSEPVYRIETRDGLWVCTDEVETRLEQSYPHAITMVEALTGRSPRGVQGGTGPEFVVNDRTRDASLIAVREGGMCYEGMAGQPPR